MRMKMSSMRGHPILPAPPLKRPCFTCSSHPRLGGKGTHVSALHLRGWAGISGRRLFLILPQDCLAPWRLVSTSVLDWIYKYISSHCRWDGIYALFHKSGGLLVFPWERSVAHPHVDYTIGRKDLLGQLHSLGAVCERGGVAEWPVFFCPLLSARDKDWVSWLLAREGCRMMPERFIPSTTSWEMLVAEPWLFTASSVTPPAVVRERFGIRDHI